MTNGLHSYPLHSTLSFVISLCVQINANKQRQAEGDEDYVLILTCRIISLFIRRHVSHDFITLKESYLTTLSEEFLIKADLAALWLSNLILALSGV